jgi:hypothetical protein
MQQLLQRHRERWKKPIVSHRQEQLLQLQLRRKLLQLKYEQIKHLQINEQQKPLLLHLYDPALSVRQTRSHAIMKVFAAGLAEMRVGVQCEEGRG